MREFSPSMQTTSVRTLLALVCVAVGSLLAACGGGSAAAPETITSASTATATAPDTERTPPPDAGQPAATPTASDVQMVQVERVLAPIETLEVVARTSLPPQYSLLVTSGLPSGCAIFDRYEMERAGDVITVNVWNFMPKADSGAVCTMIYRTMDHAIALDNLEAGQTYTVHVNDQSTTLTVE